MRGSCDPGGASNGSRLVIYKTLTSLCDAWLRICAIHPFDSWFPARLCVLLIISDIYDIYFFVLFFFLFVVFVWFLFFIDTHTNVLD